MIEKTTLQIIEDFRDNQGSTIKKGLVVWVRKDEIRQELKNILDSINNYGDKICDFAGGDAEFIIYLMKLLTDCPHVPDNSEPLDRLNSGNSQQSVGVKSSSEEPETLIVEAGVGVTPAKVGKGSIPSTPAEDNNNYEKKAKEK